MVKASVDLELSQLQKLLKEANSSGLESISGEAEELPKQPELFVQQFGYVQLPLLEQTAGDLIRICQPAPFGKNFDTVYDVAVRDSYQLEPEQIEVRNPKWTGALAKLVDHVSGQLGWHGAIEHKLYKLLLYKSGGHFKKHQDTEKDKNMFATLVLQLPSVYEGGEFVCYHRNGIVQTYKLGNDCDKAATSVNFVAHYADVKHEVREVTSGYRLALVYSLCWLDGGNKREQEGQDAAIPHLATLLAKVNDASSQYAMLLDHEYTEASLKSNGVKVLKGIDNDRFDLLSKANAMLPNEKQFAFYVIYATFEINEYDTGGYQPCEDDEDDDDNYVDSVCEWEEFNRLQSFEVYDLNGEVDQYQFSAKSFETCIDPNGRSGQPFADLNNEGYWDGKNVQINYSGNQGPDKTTQYHKCLLAFWPRCMSFESQLKFSSLKRCVSFVYEAIMAKPSASASDVADLEALVGHLGSFAPQVRSWEVKKKPDSDATERIFELCKKLDRIDLVERTLSHQRQPSVVQIRSLVDKFTWPRIQKSLTPFLHPVGMETLYFNCNLIKSLFETNGQETAFAVFQFALAPILNDHAADKSLSCLAKWIQLAKIIFLFASTRAANLEKLINCLDGLKQYELQNIIEGLVQSFSKSDLSCFKQLFQARIEFLEENTKCEPVFSWRMPGSITSYRDLDAFLRSNEQSITYRGSFYGIDHARSFQYLKSGLHNGYSIEILDAAGTGSEAYVTIEKTKAFFDSQVKLTSEYRREISKLKDLLK